MTIQHADGDIPAAARPRRRWLVAVAERVILILVIAAGALAWATGVAARQYDYDEVQRAHSIWLASQGLRPYTGFFEVHPPYFVLLTPVFWWSSDPCSVLLALRLVSAAGNIAFLCALVALCRGPAGVRDRWVWLGVALVALHPRILDFLVEFRVDGWGYALVTWSLFAFLRKPGVRWRYTAFGAGSGIATLLLCPKVALLPPLVVAMTLVRERPAPGAAVRAGAAYLAGLVLAGLGFALYLAANRIALDRTYLLLFRYHALSNAHSAFRNGLLRQVAATPLLLWPVVLGLLAWAWKAAKTRSLDDAYLPALALWLLAQALLVAYPYKQYYAPWFLYASAFVIVLGRTLDEVWRPLGTVAFVACAVTTLVAVLAIAALWDRYRPAAAECATIRALNALARPEDGVVAPAPHHPVVRRDVFFVWFNTSDPRGYDSERILAGLGPYREVVSPDASRAALEATPPAFVVLDEGPVAAPYPAVQWRALREFLIRRGYRVVRLGALRLALRPDRYHGLRSSGLFHDVAGPLGPVMPSAR
jgi:hypothetical protein